MHLKASAYIHWNGLHFLQVYFKHGYKHLHIKDNTIIHKKEIDWVSIKFKIINHLSMLLRDRLKNMLFYCQKYQTYN